MTQKSKGWVLVASQFTCIALLLMHGSGALLNGPGTIPFLLGLLLLLASLFSMPPNNYSVHPMPAKKGRFIAAGPYRYIRHPMYSSVILMCAGLVVNPFILWKLFIWFFLIMVLIKKMDVEESLLEQQYPEYTSYKNKTKKLIPYLW
jgi:protein-S-isoprenylcysteine O-methyltransferase Ste14